MKRAQCDDPVTVLREFQRRFLRGRLLDLASDSESCEGRTTEIFVSRSNLFEDAVDELLGAEERDFSVPLEVTFTGECAEDYGGPRREFLGAMIREIKERLFQDVNNGFMLTQDIVSVSKKYYFCAGLVFGKYTYTILTF